MIGFILKRIFYKSISLIANRIKNVSTLHTFANDFIILKIQFIHFDSYESVVIPRHLNLIGDVLITPTQLINI